MLDAGFEVVPAIFFDCGAAEEVFPAALSRPVINHKVSVDVQLYNPASALHPTENM